MDKPKGNSSNEFNDLFEVKCFFDPLKSLLKKISDKQNAFDIEIKLIKDSINAKADKKDIEDISLKVTSNINMFDNKIKLLKDKLEDEK